MVFYHSNREWVIHSLSPSGLYPDHSKMGVRSLGDTQDRMKKKQKVKHVRRDLLYQWRNQTTGWWIYRTVIFVTLKEKVRREKGAVMRDEWTYVVSMMLHWWASYPRRSSFRMGSDLGLTLVWEQYAFGRNVTLNSSVASDSSSSALMGRDISPQLPVSPVMCNAYSWLDCA